jgi:pimeloyl-ACP methyl ester carboxylesterase
VGDVLGHTLSPIIARVMWPLLMSKMFGPRSVPKKFMGFPKEMAVRPPQIRASAAESALMIPDAIQLRDEYPNLKMPVVIIAGDQDRLIDIDAQSARLHREVYQSSFHRIRGTGHMVHQTATGQLMAAINEVGEATRTNSPAQHSLVDRLNLAKPPSLDGPGLQHDSAYDAQTADPSPVA